MTSELENSQSDRETSDLVTEDRQTWWDARYIGVRYDATRHDDWISKHLVLIPPNLPLIELGCGFGFIAEITYRTGRNILATDISPIALAALQERRPEIPTQRVDFERRLPFGDFRFGAVIANLCLHYFDRDTTFRVLSEIQRVLASEGVLLCRVNSSSDIHYGAGIGELVEMGLYCKNGHYKRFFDEAMIGEFFDGWDLLELKNYDLAHYTPPKNVYEIVARVRP